MTNQQTEAQKAAAQAMIKAVYDDQQAEINGRKYDFHKMTHRERRKVFAFLTKIGSAVEGQDMSFLDDPAFDPVEQVIMQNVTYGGSALSKIGDGHWEKYPGDYVQFVFTALQVISYPFTGADATN